jgi:hypothetical protein
MLGNNGGATREFPPVKLAFFDRATNPEQEFRDAVRTMPSWTLDIRRTPHIPSVGLAEAAARGRISRSSGKGWCGTEIRAFVNENIANPFARDDDERAAARAWWQQRGDQSAPSPSPHGTWEPYDDGSWSSRPSGWGVYEEPDDDDDEWSGRWSESREEWRAGRGRRWVGWWGGSA